MISQDKKYITGILIDVTVELRAFTSQEFMFIRFQIFEVSVFISLIVFFSFATVLNANENVLYAMFSNCVAMKHSGRLNVGIFFVCFP